MAKKVVSYGSTTVQVETSPVLEQGSRLVAEQSGFTVDAQGRISDAGHAPGRSRDVKFEARMASLRMRLRASGIQPATVVNFLPIKLTVNSVMPSLLGGVPAVKGEGNRYATRTWNEPDIIVDDRGDAGKEPVDFHPLQQAEAFEHEYPHGGVIALPCRADEVEQPQFAERMKDAEAAAIRWMTARLTEGDRMHNAPDRSQRHNIRREHRACATRLFELKVIHALPEWITPTRELNEVPVKCAKCGRTPDHRDAAQCGCGWILNPAKAFTDGVISEDDAALERLTRDEVLALGIGAYVAETVDEKPARIKAGLPKPLSAAAMRAFEAEKATEQARA